jgi:glycine/D-amino acid oxidase-like deaminating enzyme
MQLLKRGKKIVVFDEPEKNRASTVAAGLFNPITGKRMTKSWLVEKIFPYLFEFYTEAEKNLNRSFFHDLPIYRPFVSIEEQNEWMAQSEKESIKGFIEKIFTSLSGFDFVNDPFGGILIKQSGYLDVNSFINSIREVLKKENSFRNEFFEVSHCEVGLETVICIDVVASSVIFCEGFNKIKNPFFHWLPIRPLKGETLSITIDQMPEVVFNRGVYVVPTHLNNQFSVGATYQPNNSEEGTSAEAKVELESKLKELIKHPYRVNHQNWGIRPTTPDRRPILGSHPIHKNIIVFNGLGTKGVSLAPYFSAHLVDWMDGKTELLNEVNIERFKALYSKSSSL